MVTVAYGIEWALADSTGNGGQARPSEGRSAA
jgi:hypothetical protein